MPDDAPAFSVVLHYDPMMLAEIALGADHPHDIAERYGVDAVDYEQLASQEWFQTLVAQKRHEYHDSGVLFTAKAAMMAESLLTRLFQQSIAGVLTPPLVVDVAKQLTDIGRLKPQPLNVQPPSGNGAPFQINIQVNGSDVVASRPLVPVPSHLPATAGPDGVAAPPGPSPNSRDTHGGTAMALDFKPAGPGPPPAFISNLRVRDFDLRPNPTVNGLVGSPAAQQAAQPQGQIGVGLPTPPRSA